MKKIESKIIAVDFDDTVVKQPIGSKYPDVGPTIPEAVTVLKKLVDAGHRIIVWTVRDESQDGILKAVLWYHQNNIPLYGINARPFEESEQDSKNMRNSKSPKVRANLYIDDAAAGCPLIQEEGWRPFVDWKEIEKFLIKIGYLA